jgi:hypothetical protein
MGRKGVMGIGKVGKRKGHGMLSANDGRLSSGELA